MSKLKEFWVLGGFHTLLGFILPILAVLVLLQIVVKCSPRGSGWERVGSLEERVSALEGERHERQESLLHSPRPREVR